MIQKEIIYIVADDFFKLNIFTIPYQNYARYRSGVIVCNMRIVLYKVWQENLPYYKLIIEEIYGKIYKHNSHDISCYLHISELFMALSNISRNSFYWDSQWYFTCRKKSWKIYFWAQNKPKNTKNREILHIIEDTKLHFFEIPYRNALEGISHVSKKRPKNTFFAQKWAKKCSSSGGR